MSKLPKVKSQYTAINPAKVVALFGAITRKHPQLSWITDAQNVVLVTHILQGLVYGMHEEDKPADVEAWIEETLIAANDEVDRMNNHVPEEF